MPFLRERASRSARLSRSPHLRASSLHAMIPAVASGDQSHTLNEDPAERDELETSDTVKKVESAREPLSSELPPSSPFPGEGSEHDSGGPGDEWPRG